MKIHDVVYFMAVHMRGTVCQFFHLPHSGPVNPERKLVELKM